MYTPFIYQVLARSPIEMYGEEGIQLLWEPVAQTITASWCSNLISELDVVISSSYPVDFCK